MYAQLGELFFDKQTAFTSLNESGEARYAEHNLINRKPKLEPTGLTLAEKQIGLMLNIQFCNVAAIRQQLATYRDNYTALPLIWGTGKVDGVYVITRIDTDITQQLRDGTVVSCTLTVALKEYVEDLIKEEEKQAKKEAPAVDKTPVKRTVTNKPTCATRVAQDWQIIQSCQRDLERLSQTSAYDGTLYVLCEGQNAMTKILLDLDKMEAAAKRIYNETLDPKSCVYNDLSVRQSSSDLLRKIPPFRDFVKLKFSSTTDPLPEIQLYTNNLRTYVDALHTTLNPYLTKKITKRG